MKNNKEKHPASISIKVDGLWQVIRWHLASEEEKKMWLEENSTQNGGDPSGRGERPGHGKANRKKGRGGRI